MRRSLVLREKTRIMLQMLRINLKSSFIALIGLTLALSTITSCLIYIETNRAEYYLSFIENTPSEETIAFQKSLKVYGFQGPNTSTIMSIQNALEKQISDHNLDNVLVKNPLSPKCSELINMNYLNYSLQQNFYSINLNESMLNDCIEGSYLPTTMNETLVFIPESLDLNIGDNLNISTLYYPDPDSTKREYYSHTMRISGLITPKSLRNNTSLRDLLYSSEIIYDQNGIVLISDINHFLLLFEKITSIITSLTNNTQYYTSIYAHYSFDLISSNIDHHNVIRIVSNLISYSKENEGNLWKDIISIRRNNLKNVRKAVEEYNFFFFIFLLLSIPAFLLTILLVRFSLGLVNEQRKKAIIIFKMRGYPQISY